MDQSESPEDFAFGIMQERERRIVTHPLMGWRFDQARQEVVNLIERATERTVTPPSSIEPIQFTAVNTDSQITAEELIDPDTLQ